MKKLREWLNILLVKQPGRVILASILLFNVLFFLIAALVIRSLPVSATAGMGFLEAVFCTVTMILDAGCIQFVIEDIGAAGVGAVLFCLLVVLVGMISFTGAVIGYITNYISDFVEHANSGGRRLTLTGHNVILNWNSRASEIINDLLYEEGRQRVVVLTGSRKEEIEKEINERLSDTVARENAAMMRAVEGCGFLRRKLYYLAHRFRKSVTVIVRQGDVFSSKQLHDISLEYARMVIILGSDLNSAVCKYEYREALENSDRGHLQTVKTLMQVADITSAAYSSDNQKIIVEVTDNWTAELVDRIILAKQVEGKCNIVPVHVGRVLGHILSQFSLMPELNLVYRELFSNKGVAFFAQQVSPVDEREHIVNFLQTNHVALPLTFMEKNGKTHSYYVAESARDIARRSPPTPLEYQVSLNRDYWLERRNVVILGHNSRTIDIMRGFEAFCGEWSRNGRVSDILRIIVIDEKGHLDRVNHYRDFPFVEETVEAEIHQKDHICRTIERFVDSNEEDTSILILSDDTALNEDVDGGALANLIYVQDIIRKKETTEPDFDPESIDVVVEIIDPKHHDIVNTYSVKNVVISNRYISKMITQIGEKEALFDFYTDILTYDEAGSEGFESKEVYVKKVSRFFEQLPTACTADELVRAVYAASVDPSIPLCDQNPSIVLGYVKPGGEMVLFGRDRARQQVCLEPRDKLILFSNH